MNQGALPAPVVALAAMLALALMHAPSGSMVLTPEVAPSAATVWHVAITGADIPTCGAEATPCQTIDYTVNTQPVAPGDTVKVHAGIYVSLAPIILTKSGLPGQPIVLMGAGDGTATIQYQYTTPVDACTSQTAPTFTRAIKFGAAVDHWVLRDLNIIGGVVIQGTAGNPGIDIRDQSLPGQDAYDPGAADNFYTAVGSDPSESIHIINNDLSDLGILAFVAYKAVIDSNTVHDINCWSGGGMWVGRFVHKTFIRDNRVHDIAGSANHWMIEGIRVAAASSYNTIERNIVERIGDVGRGITADVHSNWNVYRYNTARSTSIGFSEEEGNHGNMWLFNSSSSNRRWNYSAGFGQNTSNDESADWDGLMECNASSAAGQADIGIQAVNRYTFRKNQFARVNISSYWTSQWKKVGTNTWDGKKSPPRNIPATNPTGTFAQCPAIP